MDLGSYPLLSALRDRRSRRFGLGMTMPAGPLKFTSRHPPAPLSEDQEALLAWAACGVSGPALADLCYAPTHGGNIMAGLAGRTVASGDALQTVALVVINDQGTWLVRRPQDMTSDEVAAQITLAREGRFTEAYHRSRVPLSEGRTQAPLEPIHNINANRWSLHAPGSTYFLPVGDLTPMYLNGLLEILNEDTGVFILDERNLYRPAGLAPFARSRGGHLEDDPARGRVITIRQLEQFVTDFVNLEMGMVLQNLGLMTQALGLAGFPHFANHEYSWFQALGFTCLQLPASRYLGTGALVAAALKLTGRDLPVPLPVALERNGQTLLRALTPPSFGSMTEAVQWIADSKFGPRGIFRGRFMPSAWLDPATVTSNVPAISPRALAAATAYVDYVWRRYRRFPVHVPPFRCGLAHQAMHIDAEFYDTFYHPDALSETQRREFERTARALTRPRRGLEAP